MARVAIYNSTMVCKQHTTPTIRYVQQVVVVVRRTVQLIWSLPAAGSGLIISSKLPDHRTTPRKGTEMDGRAAAHIVKEEVS